MKIDGLTIPHPVVFRERAPRHENRVGAAPSRFAVKPAVVHKPSAPKALYAMPVIVIVAAAASIAGGVAAFAAATTVVGMVLAGAMVVGGAMTIIGTMTDRPNLVKWGGILSIAGSLGTAAIGMMGADAAAGAVAADGASGYVDAIGNVAEGASAGASTATAVPVSGYVDVLGNAAEGASAGASTVAPVPPPAGMLAEAAPPPAPAAQAPAPPPAPTVEAPAPLSSSSALTTPQATGPNAFDANAALQNPASGSAPSWWDRLGAWAEKNPQSARALSEGARGLLGSAVPKPQTEYERAMAEAARTRAEVEARRNNLRPGWWSRLPAGG